MAILAENRRYTADDLLTDPELESFELVDGQPVEKSVGTESTWVAGRLVVRLTAVAESIRAWVFPETSYQCFPDDPQRVRRPDVSVVVAGRFRGERLPKGHTRIAPDLAIEVLSPNDTVVESRIKVGEYLCAGVRLVWVLEPESRTVEVHRASGPAEILGKEAELTGEDVLPAFRCRIADLFPPVPSEEPTP
jgi:Uma2 family endonuclease